MTKHEAYTLGVEYGLEAAMYGDFTEEEMGSSDKFFAACFEICDNMSQYAGHPVELFNADEPDADDLYDEFVRGEVDGIYRGIRERNIPD